MAAETLLNPPSAVRDYAAGQRLAMRLTFLWIFASASQALQAATESIEQLLIKFTSAPVPVQELVASREWPDGAIQHMLVRFDGTNFITKTAADEASLFDLSSDRVDRTLTGRFDELYWYYAVEDQGTRPSAGKGMQRDSFQNDRARVNPSIQEAMEKALECLTLGIDFFSKERPVWENSRASWVDSQGIHWEAELEEPAGDTILLIATANSTPPTTRRHVYTAAPDRSRFISFERYEIDPISGQTEWLETFTISRLIPLTGSMHPKLLRPEHNVGSSHTDFFLNRWWSDQTAVLSMGIAVFILSYLVRRTRILSDNARAPTFVLGTLAALMVLGVVSAIAALVAVIQHQPLMVWFPLGLLALYTLTVVPGRWKHARAQYQRDEIRRMEAF